MNTENVNVNDVNEPAADVATAPEAAPAQMIDVASAVDTIVARGEATQIIVNIINAFLNVRQKSENKLTDEEIAAIQNAINEESAKTDALFAAVNESLNPQFPNPEVAETPSEDASV